MSEVDNVTEHVAGAKKRGRPVGWKKDPNAPAKEKKASTTLLKIFVFDAAEYEAFIAGKSSFTSVALAKEYADNLATEAESAGNPNSRFAVIEEHGILAAEVKRTVVRNFQTSRVAVAKPAADAQEGTQTSAEASPAGETATAESTPSEAAPEPHRRRR